MNYSALIKGLLGEVKACKQYRRLPTAIRVLAFIGMLPFIILAASLLLSYTVYGFVFNMLAASVAYLEAWLHGERKDLHHATEAVLYLVCTPTIFFMHCILSAFACVYFIVWFLLQCFLYIATLGGIRFQPYINTASYEAGEVSYEMRGSVPALISVVSVAFGLFVLWLIFYIVSRIQLANSWYSEFTSVANVTDIIYTLFSAIAIPICAKKVIDAKAELTDALPADDDGADELELPEV